MDLPRAWVTAGTNIELWGEARTYKAIPFDALPPVGGPLDGSFDWLRRSPSSDGMLYGPEHEEPTEEPAIADRLEALTGEARDAGLEVPDALATFMLDPELRARVPSCTACYWELGTRLVPIPGHAGPERLLRFMNDQQACYLWYLLLQPGGTARVAFAAPAWTRSPGARTFEDAAVPRDLAICAETFEEFMKRLWIESTLWFSASRRTPPDPALRAYAEAAKRAVAAGLVGP